jgi:uncharacterized protein (TIGR03437 family)
MRRILQQLTLLAFANGTIVAQTTPPARSLPDGYVGESYSSSLKIISGAYSCALVGALPPGTTIDSSGGPSPLLLTGTPEKEGVYTFELRCQSIANYQSPIELFDYTVKILPNSPLQISTGILPDGYASGSYLYRLVATGGTPPYSWGLSGTPLPPGLALDGVTGVISGIPASGGVYRVTVHVLDSKGATIEKTYTLTITPQFVFASRALSDGITGVAYREVLGASGGTPPYTYGVTTGNLPPGVLLNSTTGVISGVPTASGTVQFGLTARDNALRALAVSLSIKITSPVIVPPIVGLPLHDGYIGEPYAADLAAWGVSHDTPWCQASPPPLVLGVLPPSLIIAQQDLGGDPKSCRGELTLLGTPQTEGFFTFGVTGLGTRQDYTLRILPRRAPLVFTSSMPQARVGSPYSSSLLSGGRTPLQFSIQLGNAPEGMEINSQTSALIGTPKFSGDYAFTLAVTDSTGGVFTQGYRVSVLPYNVGTDNIVSAASYATGPVSPGEIVAIFGADLGPVIVAKQTIDDHGLFGTTLAGTRVLFGGVPSPLLFVSYGQVGVVVPYGIAGTKTVRLEVEHNGTRTNSVDLAVADVSPAIFTASSTGTGPSATLNQDYTLNTKSNPAQRGSVIMLYVTGLGLLDPPTADGAIAKGIASHLATVTVQIGGNNAQVLYAGSAPGIIAGLSQVNVQIPANAPTGEGVPVVLTAAGIRSQDGVTVSVK